MYLTPCFARRHFHPFGLAAFAVFGTLLLACQSVIIEEPPQGTQTYTAPINTITSQAKFPQSAKWRQGTDTGAATLFGTTNPFHATMVFTAPPTDTVWLDLYRGGIRIMEVAYRFQGTTTLEYANVYRQDLAAIDLFTRILPRSSAASFDSVFAKGLVNSDPLVKAIGFPAKQPVGLDTAAVWLWVMKMLLAKQQPLSSLAQLWALGIDSQEVHLRVKNLVDLKLISSDTLVLFPPPLVRVVTPLHIDSVLIAGGASKAVTGVFAATNQLSGSLVRIYHDSLDQTRDFDFEALSTLDRPLRFDLEGKLSVAARATAAPGNYRLVVLFQDDDLNKATASVNFRVAPVPDTQLPAVIRIAGSRTLDFDSTLAVASWQISDNGTLASVSINGTAVVGAGEIYATKLNLNIGPNRACLVATDAAGNERLDTIVIRRTDKDTSSGYLTGKLVGPDSVEVGATLLLSASLDIPDTSKHRISTILTKAEWDLDGKGFHDSALVTKAYARWLAPGLDTVKLRLTNTNAIVSILSKVIRVVNTGSAIQLIGTANPIITPSDSVTFQLMTRDTSGVASVIWDFGDGTTKTSTGNAPTITHTYPGTPVVKPDSTKTYPLSVTVIDSLNGRTTKTVAQVTVSNLTPTGTVTGPTTGLINTTYSFRVSVAPIGKRIAHAEWDLGDATWLPGSDTGRTVQWTTAGPYTVRVKLTDKDSNAVIFTAKPIKIAVANFPSTISGFHDTIITPNDEINFTINATDLNGVAKVLWNFGDGSTETTMGQGPTFTAPPHTYPGGTTSVSVNTSKVYKLKLQVVDNLNAITQDSVNVTITNDMPVVTNFPKDTIVEVGTSLHLSVIGKDLGYLSYSWSLDGSTFFPGRADTTIAITKNLPGIFVIYLLTKDEDNNTRQDSVKVLLLSTPDPFDYSTPANRVE